MGKIRYTTIVEWDPEESLYVSTLPALSIGSYGQTRQEAMEKIREAAEVTIEGLKATAQPVPVEDQDLVSFVELTA